MNKINKYKKYRFWLRLLFVLVAYLLPLIVIVLKEDVFYKSTTTKIMLSFLVIASLLLFQFKKELGEWINAWEFSLLKIFLQGIAKVWIFLLVFALITLAEQLLPQLYFIVGWIAIPSSIAYLFIKPFSEKFDYLVKRELRKQEMREVIKE